MRALTFAVVLLMFAGLSTARAQAYFVNATSNTYTVEATFPNKKVEKRTLEALSISLASEYFNISPGIATLDIVIKDDKDAVAWRGKTGRDDMMLLVPDPKQGIRAVYAGIYGGPEAVRGELFMNATGEQLTIDLEGGNGIAASRGVVPPPAFDPKRMVKLDPKESTYVVIGKMKGSADLAFEGKVSAFHYCLLWKTTQGEYRATELGAIPAPASKAKKKKK